VYSVIAVCTPWIDVSRSSTICEIATVMTLEWSTITNWADARMIMGSHLRTGATLPGPEAHATATPQNRPMPALTILIRHADVPDPAGSDPALNGAGRARAKELRHVLGDAHVDSIFVTQFRRTQQTAKPLAAQLGIDPTVIEQDDVARLTDTIRDLPASAVALVIGHTTTLPDICAGLGGPPMPAIGPAEFDRLFVQARNRLAQLRYGA